MLTSAIGLRGESAGADTQETEVPVQQIKEHGADSDSTDSRSVTEVPDYRGVHYPDQRYRYIRQDTRHGQT